MSGRKSINGRVILVQEDRFRLVSPLGRGYLLALSHRIPTSQADLRRWQAHSTRLRVEFEGQPNLATGIAHRITPLT